MKILMINKFLYPNGGSETYIFKLGKALEEHGHEVQYFGMEHTGRCVGNNMNAYTSDMDFHKGLKMSKILYPIKTIYSLEARKKIRLILDDFKPDVCHLNNFNYQLTPSIILEIKKWSRQTGHKCRIIYTAHDYQLVCPNHMMNNYRSHENCEKCLGGHYYNCVRGNCIHGSKAKSMIGCLEATFWNRKATYKNIDTIICCSEFMKSKLDKSKVLQGRTIALHNFIDAVTIEKEDTTSMNMSDKYCLYFGRFSEEKGIGTLIKACKALPEVRFIFAGTGSMETELNSVNNIENVGFQTGEKLEILIRQASFTIYPSEWYENCPFSVMESQMYGTPVIGAAIGGIPELIQNQRTGMLFESGNVEELVSCIRELWNEEAKVSEMSENCSQVQFDTVDQYYSKLIKIYNGEV
ncbi:glycosyltransferase family 4 protein [Hominiventricola aquisgranensis]|uniref:Glycosyltransferase family 4 protein n=1 Tax=Hominiventricola aquisgranensis TaxID=3133164 RepID=A0ABV1I0X7_9FIRM